MMRNFIGIRLGGLSCGLAYFVLGVVLPRVALAQIHGLPTEAKVHDPRCLTMASERCLLKADYPAFEMVTAADGRLEILLKSRAASEGGESAVVTLLSVSEDLDARIARGELSDVEAQEIWSELAKSDGTLYAIPSLSELKAQLGFPPDAVVTNDDLIDLCRSHIQLILGVSPVVSLYISMQLGLEATGVDASELLPGPSLEEKIVAMPEIAPVDAVDIKSDNTEATTSIRN